MDIRAMTDGDYDGVCALMRQVHALHASARPDIYADVDPLSRDYFNTLLGGCATIALVAELSGELIGFCVVTLRPPSSNPVMRARIVAYMEDLCVDARHRTCGVGARLFEAAKSLSAQRGASSLELMVWSFNEPALAFYEHMGMAPRSVIMELPLPPG